MNYTSRSPCTSLVTVCFLCFLQLIFNSKSISFILAVNGAPLPSNLSTADERATVPAEFPQSFSAVNMVRTASYCFSTTDTITRISNKILLQFEFMQRFGYLDTSGASGSLTIAALHSELAVQDALKNVQKFGAIPETGVLDEATVGVSEKSGIKETLGKYKLAHSQLMTSPRCGVPDILRGAPTRVPQRRRKLRRRRKYKVNQRPKRFAVGARGGWIKRRITYL